MPDPLAADTTVVLNRDNVVEAPLERELYMMDVEEGRYYYLNEVATAIWQRLLQRPCTAAELCLELQRDFDVPPEQCLAEVLAFLRTLHAKQLLQVVA